MTSSSELKRYKLTSLKLDGTNWHLWRQDVVLASHALGIFQLLEPATKADDISVAQQSNLHHALNQAMDNNNRIMTMHCISPEQVWKTLKDHYESRYATDILILTERFQQISLSDPSKITLFLDEIKLAHNALITAGRGYSDDELTLQILQKLPPSMENLTETIKFGSPDMLKPEKVIETLKRYQQHHAQKRTEYTPETAYYSKDTKRSVDKKNTKCHFCGKLGHWKAECRKRARKQKPNREQAHIAFAALTTKDRPSHQSWVVDTAATISMSPFHRPDLEKKQEVMIGDGRKIKATGIKTTIPGTNIQVSNVLIVPNLKTNLLSIGSACDDGVIDKAVFNKESVVLWKNDEELARGTREDRLYVIDSNRKPGENAFSTMQVWHERLGHANTNSIKKMSTKGNVTGLHIEGDDKTITCPACEMTKKSRPPFPKIGASRDDTPGRTLHVDLCGPMDTPSIQGCKYAMPITDDASRYTFTYFLARKSDALRALTACIKRVETALGVRVARIRTDNGGEFTSNEAKSFYASKGIQLLTSVPYSPQQNGVAERKNRTLIEKTRAMMKHANTPKRYWQYAMAAATHVSNTLGTKANAGEDPPAKIWNQSTPDIRHIKTFGCTAYATRPKLTRRKLDDVATECIFVGYPAGQKGAYRARPENKKILRHSRSHLRGIKVTI